MKLEFPKEFKERISRLTNFKEYEIYANKFLRRSIRINTLKISIKNLKSRLQNWKLTQIPWSKESFWIEGERRDIGHLVEHQLGYIYIQKAASLLPSIILNPKEGDLVLDMTAAPGSKTTHLAQIMKNTGLIIANDKNYRRITALSANLQRCGVTNTITTIQDARTLKGNYDKILLDAPCSASGTIRGVTQHSINTLKMYNPKVLEKVSNLQKQLILKAYQLLKPKATLVYSTCSLDPKEDEEVIQHLLKKTNAKLQKINLKIKSKSSLKNTIKLWPQFYDTEGFFIAKITKP